MSEVKKFPARDRKDETSPSPQPSPAPSPTPAPAPAPVVAPPAAPQAAPPPAPTQEVAPKRRRRSSSRFVLLVLLPALAAAAGFWWWLSSGRYVSTDNAYIGAEKVLITPQVTGAIVNIDVVEGQHVNVGDKLFEIDPAPYRTAVALAKARIEAAKNQYANLELSYKANADQVRMSQDAVRVRQSDYDRKSTLAKQGAGTQNDLDSSNASLIQARQILAFVEQQQQSAAVQLGGDPNAPLERFPAYMEATTQLEDAERNLRNAEVVAPIAGVATQVPQIQLGRVTPAGTPVFAIVNDRDLWIDANPKESDLTYVHPGLPVSISVDTFPDRTWCGKVGAIAPGTGAQFAILPPQNASGNWVKVVQRVPLRVEFCPDQDTKGLRAGLSTIVDIDTGRQHTLSGLWASLVETKDAWLGALISSPKAAEK
ncbi:MAG TPA: HlyD family secretion protein [Roseiarcus sp.]|nr:HlyD family secretion protein [Roseiarcus sp.]